MDRSNSTMTARTKKAPPPVKDGVLQSFDGQEVTGTTIKIINAGDGLSKAMETEPVMLHHGQKAYVVIECDVARVSFDPVDRDEPAGNLLRVHTLRAGTSTLVDFELVNKVITEQARKNTLADEARKGITRLPGTDDDEEWEDSR
jgi:hypothetical protein